MFICIIWNIFGTKKKRNATQQNKRREEKSESLIVAQPKFIALKWIIPNSETHTHTHIEIGHIWTAKFITYIFVLLFSSVRFGSVQVHHNWTIWNVFAEFSEAIVSKRASEQAIHSRWLFLELVFPSSMNALYLVCRRWFNSHHEHCQRHFISHIITANFVAYFICLPFLSFTLFFFVGRSRYWARQDLCVTSLFSGSKITHSHSFSIHWVCRHKRIWQISGSMHITNKMLFIYQNF